jgi:hypothetical protein
MLDYVDRRHPVERSVRERIGKMLQFAQHVGPRPGVPIDADRAWMFVDSAADVEDSQWISV